MVAAAVPSYQWLRDYAKAMQYHTQALAIAKEVGDGVVRVGLCVQFSFSKTHDKSSALASFLMARESPKEVEGRNTGG